GGIAIITGCGVLGTWLSSRERTGPVAVALPQPPQAGKQPNCSA
ncbi:MAG: hypothetical protein RJB37_3851, partial [Pseudomonadota bacterium]